MGNVPKKLQLLKPLPGGGGSGNVRIFDVVISTDANGAYTTDKTLTQIIDAHNAGNVVRCQYNHDDITITTGVAQVVSSNGQHCAICPAFDADGNQAYFFIEETGITLIPYSGGSGEPEEPGQNGKSAYEYAKEAGYTGTEEEFAEKLAKELPTKLPNPHALSINGAEYDGSKAVAITIKNDSGGVNEEAVKEIIEAKDNSVKAYGAIDDTANEENTHAEATTKAFKDALAANRTVTVPGGLYVLNDTLVIRENCGLELSQDTVLKFTKTSGNCIEMRGSAVLRGNHAVLVAPYELTGNVISMDTLLDGTNHASIPPYEKACPQWKRQRFVYDVNIIKPNSSGFNRPLSDGVCSGTAIYASATNVPLGTDNPDNTDIPFLWGVSMSGIRIAGGFSFGIRAINFDSNAPEGYIDDAWNHDMRIEAVIEGCEIGTALENCNGARLNVTVQPTVSNPGGTKYAKHGIYLKDSRYVDLTGSRVWDWHNKDENGITKTSKWEPGNEWQHLALIGNCRGLLLDDFNCTETSGYEIRDLIYTDTESNFDTMTILQEPGNKNFKVVDGKPYFNDGISNKALMLKTDKFSAEQAEFIKSADGYYTYEDNFTNLVDGYQQGYYIGSNGSLISDGDGQYVTTDFIPLDGADVHTYYIGGKEITWDDPYGQCRICWYDANKAVKGNAISWDKIGSSIYYPQWVDDDSVAAAFSTSANNAGAKGAAYFRITAKGSGENLVVTVDEKQDYNAIWHGEPKRLDESIYAQSTFLKAPNGTGYRLIVNNDGTLGTEPMD